MNIMKPLTNGGLLYIKKSMSGVLKNTIRTEKMSFGKDFAFQ